MMTINEYMVRAHETAVYPEDDQMKAIAYLILGLTGEAGETANTFKKYLRGDMSHENGKIDPVKLDEMFHKILDEIGDVLWYVAELCTTIGIPIEEVARANLAKLKRRNEEGTIKGDEREEKGW